MASSCAHLSPLLRPFAAAAAAAAGRRALPQAFLVGSRGALRAEAAPQKPPGARRAPAAVCAASVLQNISLCRAAARSSCGSFRSSSAEFLTSLQRRRIAEGAGATTVARGSAARLFFGSQEAAAAELALTPRCKAATGPACQGCGVARRLLSSSASAAASSSSSAAAAAPDEEEAYHAGLIHTEFSHDLHISKDTPVIPIFRVLNYEGKLTDGWHAPFSNEEAVEVYQFMVKLSIWDNLFYNIQRQGRISFYIQNQGEEALQVAVGRVLDPKDHLFCQYRELGVLLLHGFTEEDVLDQLFARKGDESKGRQMPISYSKRSINLHTICTPLTTQVPHAAGAGYAFKVTGEDRIAVAFFGEGAASEGDFHAAMNFAATLKSQTLFACRNNGYAISTPVKDQYAGDGIAIRGVAYGMKTVRVDGNDVFACFLAAKRAREIILEEREPVLIEFMTYRVGHHSTSDDSMQYRPQGELEKWNQSGVHPIARLRRYLENNNLWTEQQDEELRKGARTYMLQKLKAVEKHKRWPVIPGIFDDVYDKEPWHLKEQREGFTEYLEQHKQLYPQLKEYESSQ